MAGPQLTQAQVDELKAKCQECKTILESAGCGTASGRVDAQQVVAAIGDGTIWQLILQYGPRIFDFLMEILERYTQPTTP